MTGVRFVYNACKKLNELWYVIEHHITLILFLYINNQLSKVNMQFHPIIFRSQLIHSALDHNDFIIIMSHSDKEISTFLPPSI